MRIKFAAASGIPWAFSLVLIGNVYVKILKFVFSQEFYSLTYVYSL